MAEHGKGRGRGRVVVVTGGTGGVGRATARAFADSGYDVAVLARGEDALRATEQELQDRGVRALAVQCDVADADAVEAAAQRVEDELGEIDVWVNNAMVTVFGRFESMTDEEFTRVTDVTYLGTAYGTRAALRRMKPRDRGRIVQVGSSLAYRGIPGQSAYCGAKHAIQGLSDSLRAELLHDKSGVTLTMVQLPAINTPQFRMNKSYMPRKAMPVPPIYQPEVAAQAVLKAAEGSRREYWVAPITALTILGDKVAPGLLDRYLGRSGLESQQVDEPEEQGRPDNLYAPLPGDHGAHGVFDGQAKPRTVEWVPPVLPRAVVGVGTTLAITSATLVSGVAARAAALLPGPSRTSPRWGLFRG
ncbi:SDR family oxidoreductase [Motilibacter aurantiacus]|uniref:SDR family oxidoreductase n=1 Tax=Motilibacter aurantiacus TaxID=2714955 RepID=UPI00140E14F8|nr:SDR family oxidoreductase [Motilibacter aurantiacus]NHC47614.1 SDR family oxidoreductase [Motilibacter aurantiacus]